MSDGTRTRDRLDHNQELYQLSYAHRETPNLSIGAGSDARGEWVLRPSATRLGQATNAAA